MSYSQIIPVGTYGQISISEAAGVATLQLSLADQAGGGPLAGFAKATVSAGMEVSAQALIDAGLALLVVKFPAAAALVGGIQAIIDAEIKNA